MEDFLYKPPQSSRIYGHEIASFCFATAAYHHVYSLFIKLNVSNGLEIQYHYTDSISITSLVTQK